MTMCWWKLQLLVLVACNSVAVRGEALSAAVLDVPPYGARESNGRITGAYADLLTVIVQSAGYTPELQLLPYARASKLVRSGNVDLSLMFTNDQLKAETIAVAAITRFDVILLGATATGKPLQRDNLSGLVVGRLHSGCAELTARTDLQFVDSNSHESGLKMLNQHRINAFCSVYAALAVSAKNIKMDLTRFGPPLVLGSREVWLQARKDLPEQQVTALRMAIARLQANGKLKRLTDSYALNPAH